MRTGTLNGCTVVRPEKPYNVFDFHAESVDAMGSAEFWVVFNGHAGGGCLWVHNGVYLERVNRIFGALVAIRARASEIFVEGRPERMRSPLRVRCFYLSRSV